MRDYRSDGPVRQDFVALGGTPAIFAALAVLFCLGHAQAQETETYVLRQTVSNRETIVYTRIIEFDSQKRLFHVRDYYENGRLQMDAFYSSFDKRVKEDYQCNYRSSTKEGP